MAKKKILVVCAMPRDRRELMAKKYQSQYDIYFHDFGEASKKRMHCHGAWLSSYFDHQEELDKIIDLCTELKVDGLIDSQDYPGSILAAIAAEQLGLRAPSPRSVLLCHNKFLSRIMQADAVPEQTPEFLTLKSADARHFAHKLPLFIKPIKANTSVLVHLAKSEQELAHDIKQACPSRDFMDQFNWFLERYHLAKLKPDEALGEKYLQGMQCTLEGAVFDHQISFFGVTDSIMLDDSVSFARFQYPSKLPRSAIAQMESVATRLIHHVGFNNGLFNMEFFYDPDQGTMHIIEVNPRMASQFADLYEKVDGSTNYQALLAIATNERPVIAKGQGEHKVAASFVLRRPSDAMCIKVPSAEDLEQFYQTFPDGRFEVFAEEGRALSEQAQDGHTFRYGLIHLGARDQDELLEKYDRAKRILSFEFEEIK